MAGTERDARIDDQASRAAATAITGGNDQDGVAQVLEDLFA